jgi:hypothetical protein
MEDNWMKSIATKCRHYMVELNIHNRTRDSNTQIPECPNPQQAVSINKRNSVTFVQTFVVKKI